MYFCFSYLYLSLAGNIIVYTPNQRTNREEYFNHIIYQRKRYRLWREMNTFPFIFPFTDRVFSIFGKKKVRVRSMGNGHQKDFSRADITNRNINKRPKRFPYREKNTRIQWKDNSKYGKNKIYNAKRFMIASYIN